MIIRDERGDRHNAKIVSRLESEIVTQWRMLNRWRSLRDLCRGDSARAKLAVVAEETRELLYMLFIIRGRKADR